MPKLKSQIHIDASAEKVFAYLSDFSRHSEWAAHPLQIQATSSPPLQEGSTFSSTAKMMGTHAAKLTVTGLEQPRRIAFEAEDDTGKFAHEITIEPRGEGGVVLTKQVSMVAGSAMSKVMAGLLMPLIGTGIIKRDVARIREKLEEA